MLENIKALVKGKDICVLATVSENGAPHCSLMAYIADEECTEIYMVTRSSTAKYKNLLNNSAVSLLIDSREITPREKAQALTASGVFQPIEDSRKRGRVHAELLTRHPHLKAFIQHPDTVLVGVKVESYLLLEGLTKSHFVRLQDNFPG